MSNRWDEFTTDQLRVKRRGYEAALEKLATGRSTALLQDQTGERIQYSRGDISFIEKQISLLSDEIYRRGCGGGRSYRGPIRMML